MKKRVVVGLSGGVDSSVAAHLLLRQGYEVIGMFMKNWHDESVTISNDCPWVEDSNDALLVAKNLGIPFQTLDLSEAYKERIVDYMFAEYKAGRTPNPDVLCNREIKFDIFLKAALQLNADFVATGHYCRKSTVEIEGKEVHKLLAGADNNKDQSYFLCQLTQNQLSKALFPVGELTKPEVREIAKSLDLVTAEKKDSQGLCFVGKIRLPEFLQQKLKPKAGKIIEIPADSPIYAGKVLANGESNDEAENRKRAVEPFHYSTLDGQEVGTHNGAHYFTIGQRKGLGVGGKVEPLFVIATDVGENVIYVGMGDDHPGLYREGLFIPNEDIHWVRPDLRVEVGESLPVKSRIRYRQPLQDATVYASTEGYYLMYAQPQRGVTPGQFATWNIGDELLGSGVIA